MRAICQHLTACASACAFTACLSPAPQELTESAVFGTAADSDFGQSSWGKSVALDSSGGVHAVWKEGDTAVVYGRSFDGGNVWDTRTLSVTTASLPTLAFPKIAAEGSCIYITWYSGTDHDFKLYFARSCNQGTTWEDPVELNAYTFASGFGEFNFNPSIAATDSAVHVVFSDEKHYLTPLGGTNASEIFIRSSYDRGATWEPAKSVSSPDGHASWVASVAAQGNDVHVVWCDERHDPKDCGVKPCTPSPTNLTLEEEYYRRSLDAGRSWTEPEQRLTNDPGPSWAPTIAATGPYVHIAYIDGRGGTFRVFYQSSSSYGAAGTWTAEKVVSGDVTLGSRASLDAAGGRVGIVWQGTRPADLGTNVYYFGSEDSGGHWAPPRLVSGSGGQAANPNLVLSRVDGSRHVVWVKKSSATSTNGKRRYSAF